jgi:hypothetical protein
MAVCCSSAWVVSSPLQVGLSVNDHADLPTTGAFARCGGILDHLPTQIAKHRSSFYRVS